MTNQAWKVFGNDGVIRAAETVEAQEATLVDEGETVRAEWERNGEKHAIRTRRSAVPDAVIGSGRCAVVVLDGHGTYIRASGWKP